MAEPLKAIRPSQSLRQPWFSLVEAGEGIVRLIALRKPSSFCAFSLAIRVAPESMRFPIVLPAILAGGPAAPFSPDGRTTPPLSKVYDIANASRTYAMLLRTAAIGEASSWTSFANGSNETIPSNPSA